MAGGPAYGAGGSGYASAPGGDYIGGYGAAPGEGGAPVQYARAAPEDLRQIRAIWKSIVGETSGMFRVMLSSAEPRFNAQDENDARLYVVFADFLAERYLNNSDRKQELEQIIADRTGKQVEVKFVLAADAGIQRGSLSSIEIDERIHENIHMDIEYED